MKRKRRKQESTRLKAPVVAAIFDSESQTLTAITGDVLTNQLKTELPKAERTFDQAHKADLVELSREIAQTIPPIILAMESKDDALALQGVLLSHAMNTLVGALVLLRGSILPQPQVLLRNMLETMALAVYVANHPQDREKVEQGKVQSSKCVTELKEVVWPVGPLYGLLTNSYSHVGPAYFFPRTMEPFPPDDRTPDIVMGHLRICLWILQVVCEYIHIPDSVPRLLVHGESGAVSLSPLGLSVFKSLVDTLDVAAQEEVDRFSP